MKPSTMTRHATRSFLVAVCISMASPVLHAQDTRAELVQRIAEAQGLNEMFEQQLAQQRDAATGYAAKLLDETLAAGGASAPNARQQAVMARFLNRANEMFSAREIVSVWVSHYGHDLSTAELQQVLAYYQSPIGRKDVAATKLAMVGHARWMLTEAEKRSIALIRDFVQDMQDASR